MKISIAEAPLTQAIPKGCFLARRGSPSGSLTMIGPDCSCMGQWNAMDLEGRSFAAIGDVTTGYSAEDVRKLFIPVDGVVTFQNEY